MNIIIKSPYTIAVTSSHTKGKENFNQKRLVVWFSNESKGISDEAAKEADVCIQIPMGGIVESLNLGTSTGIVWSYISYQRLKFIYENNKATFKPKSIAASKMQSWEKFIKPHRD